jgi:hypothetical protein
MIRSQEPWTWAVILILLAMAVPGVFAHADGGEDDVGLDAASSEALAKTQDLLKTPALRDAAIQKSQGAQLVDTQVKSLGGNSANVDSIYGLSSDIFEDLVKESHGDPLKMQELLSKAKDDPKGFAEHLSDKNKRALRDVAGKIGGAPTTAAGSATGSGDATVSTAAPARVGGAAPLSGSAVLPASNAPIINGAVLDKK